MGLKDSDPIAYLVACEEIRQLASRYALCWASRDTRTMAELFVPDIRVTRETRGTDVLEASFNEQLRPLGRVILQVTNHSIDVTDIDQATGVVSCRGEIEDATGHWIIQQIQYHDTYRRVDGRWLFSRRNHLLFYGHDMPNPPVGLPDANWPASQTGRGELPDVLDTWKAWHDRNP